MTEKARRGRPPLGRNKMVSKSVRFMPAEIALVDTLADRVGMDFASYVRECVRTVLRMRSRRGKRS